MMLSLGTMCVKHLIWIFANFICFCHVAQCHKVPYEDKVVFPKILESRSDKDTKFLKINEDLTLHLQKSSVMGKDFLLRTYQGHVMQHTYLDGELLEEDLYHDSRHFASVMVSEEHGLQVEGVLGPKLRIKPSPLQGRSHGMDIPHVLYAVEEEDGAYAGADAFQQVNVTERQAEGNGVPATIRPELLIGVDSTFRAQFSSELTLIKYMVITFNAANVRYLTVDSPRVRLKFCALEIFTPATEAFLERSGHYVLAIRSLNQIKDYVRSHPEKYRDYDGVYVVTGLDMAEYTYYGWNPGLMGYAFIGGICGNLKVGYGEDRVGTFKGVRIFAHEVGHLLGCPHDGTSTGLYSSASCPWNDGFIMSYKEEDSRSMKFSQCCNRMITQMAWSSQGTCLRTRIMKTKISKKNFTSILPGNILSRDRVCQMAFPNVRETQFIPDHNGNENCVARCFMPRHVYGYNTSLPAFLPDNSPCTENGGKMCRNGDCVPRKLKRSAYSPY